MGDPLGPLTPNGMEVVFPLIAVVFGVLHVAVLVLVAAAAIKYLRS